MNVTVILCTYNRCQSLSRALESVASSVLPDSVEWEVLVVDNNSKDQTRGVVGEFIRRFPGRFRYLFEPCQGKSHALNSGIREALGDVLAFMDDDVTVDPSWLQRLTATLNEGSWAGAGGRIVPARAFQPPPWLPLQGPHNMGGILALFDFGENATELHDAPFGTNMAFRTEIFQKYGGFRTDLGPRPGSLIRNEDTEFGRRLMAVGERLRYEHSAVVYHEVPEERLKKEYFLEFWYDTGRAGILEQKRRPDIWGIPRPYLTLLKHVLVIVPTKTLQWLLSINPQDRFYRKCWVWRTTGELVEIYRRWFAAKSQVEKPSPNIQTEPHA